MADAEAALASVPGSAEAIAGSQRAIFHMVDILRPALAGRLDAGSYDTPREGCLNALEFLDGACIASALSGLPSMIDTLADQERKVNRMLWMSQVVELADAIHSRCTQSKAYEFWIGSAGTSRSTVDNYERELQAAPLEFRPRSPPMIDWQAVMVSEDAATSSKGGEVQWLADRLKIACGHLSELGMGPKKARGGERGSKR